MLAESSKGCAIHMKILIGNVVVQEMCFGKIFKR